MEVTAIAPYGEESPALDALLKHFIPRRPDARRFALDYRAVLVSAVSGVAIDAALAAFPFEIVAIAGATPWEIAPGVTVRTCSAEALVIYTFVAARPQDLLDVAGVVQWPGTNLDVDTIRRWGRLFAELKDDPGLLQPFEAAIVDADPRAALPTWRDGRLDAPGPMSYIL